MLDFQCCRNEVPQAIKSENRPLIHLAPTLFLNGHLNLPEAQISALTYPMEMETNIEADKSAAITTVEAFLSGISFKRGPFQEARRLILSNSFCALSHPDELIRTTLGDVLTRVEELINSILDAGATSFEEQIASPGPTAWVYDDIAVVLAGYRVVIDEEAKSCGVNLFSLLRTKEGWRISGIADTQWVGYGDVPEAVHEEATPNVMGPINTLFGQLRRQEWNKMHENLLPGGGATLSRQPELLQLLFPDFIARLEDTFGKSLPPGTVIEERIHDVEMRIIGELALAWTPFTVEVGGKVVRKGTNIFTLLRKDGVWLISGIQDTGKPVG